MDDLRTPFIYRATSCRSGVIHKRSYTEEEANLVLSTLLEIILKSKYDKAAQVSYLINS